MDDMQLAYLAGLFDGEGSFSIQVAIKNNNGVEAVNFSPKLSMTLKYGNEVLKELQERFGGTIYPYADNTARWSIHGKATVKAAAEALMPHLRIKRKIAERFLHALSIFPEHRKAHGQGQRSWTDAMVREVAEIALSLNPIKRRKPRKNTEHVLDRLARIYTTDPPPQPRRKGGPGKGAKRVKDPVTGKWHWERAIVVTPELDGSSTG
jgi:hypothetical protein